MIKTSSGASAQEMGSRTVAALSLGVLMEINIIDGDIASVQADALLTAINSGGMWFGGIDGVISRIAGSQYHAQALDALRIDQNIGAIVATRRTPHNGLFRDIVFTIDDLDLPLRTVILCGLQVAEQHGCRTITMPAIRLGVMRNVGGSVEEKVQETIATLREFAVTSKLQTVSVVIFNDRQLSNMFRLALNA